MVLFQESNQAAWEHLERVPYAQTAAEQREIYLSMYETAHPKLNSRALDHFLAPLLPQDRINVKFLIYRAPVTHRNLIVELARTYCKIKPDRLVSRAAKSNIYFGGNVYLTRETFLNAEKDSRGPYFIVFHELAHAIDWRFGGALFFRTMRSEYVRPIVQAVYDKLDAHLEQLRNQGVLFEEKQRERLLQFLKRGACKDIRLDETEQALLKELRSYFVPQLSGANHAALSDAWSGATANRICGQTQHAKSYYFIGQRQTHLQGPEFFANHFAYGVLNNKQALSDNAKMFRTTVKQMDEYIQDLFDQ